MSSMFEGSSTSLSPGDIASIVVLDSVFETNGEASNEDSIAVWKWLSELHRSGTDWGNLNNLLAMLRTRKGFSNARFYKPHCLNIFSDWSEFYEYLDNFRYNVILTL